MSLSIADAKVDTFKLLAKQSGDFFSRKIEEKSQLADFQDYQFYESLQAFSKSVISMLQNIFFSIFPAYDTRICSNAKNSLYGERKDWATP